EPYAVVDALMYADGKCVVDIGDMSVRLTGLTREGIERLWRLKGEPAASAAGGSAAEEGHPVGRCTPAAHAAGSRSGSLFTRAKVTRVAASGGMISQDFDFDLADRRGSVYRGRTTFGFFSPESLAQQVGLREGGPPPVEPRGGFDMPRTAPFPDDMLRMIDCV